MSFKLDGFESGILFRVQPNEALPRDRDLHNLYTDYDFVAGQGIPGLSLTEIVTTDPHGGTYCLHNRFDQALQPQDYGSNWQFQFHTYCLTCPGFADGWKYLRQISRGDPPASYVTNTYNRLRFWLKVPTGADTPGDAGRHNIEFGTHLKELAEVYSGESNNWHFYHFFNVIDTEGEWEQFLVDPVPQHQRSHEGGEDYPSQLHPSTVSPLLNYFDLMTRFYVDFWEKTKTFHPWPLPTHFYLDDFELFEEPFNENLLQVSSLHGVYLPGSNTIRVGWMRRKAEDTLAYDITYAFSSIYVSGWAGATAAPGSPIVAAGNGSYNGMLYATTAIDVSAHGSIFIGIKPQNSALFRQIEIPLAAPPSPLLIVKPADVSVLSSAGLPRVYTFADPAVSGGTAPYTFVNTPASGSVFPLGPTVITSVVTDALGRTDSTQWTVTITSPAAPSVTCPAPIAAESLDGTAVPIMFAPIVTGGATPVVVVSTPASGSSFPIGVTTVVSVATDSLGRTASCSFTVTVINHLNPPPTGGPSAPSNPSPTNNLQMVANPVTLRWEASTGTAPITYEVCFGLSRPNVAPPVVASGLTVPQWAAPTLQKKRVYAWQINARNAGGTTPGPRWNFKTK